MKTLKPRRQIWMSIHRLTYELQVHRSVLNKLVRKHNLQPNEQGQYALADIGNAMTPDPNSLEYRAKEAKYQRIIEEAAEARRKRVEFEESHISALKGLEFVTEIVPISREIFRRLPLSDGEKQLAARTLDEWLRDAFAKFTPPGQKKEVSEIIRRSPLSEGEKQLALRIIAE